MKKLCQLFILLEISRMQGLAEAILL